MLNTLTSTYNFHMQKNYSCYIYIKPFRTMLTFRSSPLTLKLNQLKSSYIHMDVLTFTQKHSHSYKLLLYSHVQCEHKNTLTFIYTVYIILNECSHFPIKHSQSQTTCLESQTPLTFSTLTFTEIAEIPHFHIKSSLLCKLLSHIKKCSLSPKTLSCSYKMFTSHLHTKCSYSHKTCISM